MEILFMLTQLVPWSTVEKYEEWLVAKQVGRSPEWHLPDVQSARERILPSAVLS